MADAKLETPGKKASIMYTPPIMYFHNISSGNCNCVWFVKVNSFYYMLQRAEQIQQLTLVGNRNMKAA
jgi:hypothetical protein